ncbi:hypothetical protein OG535_30245 [Kitasatospora sp. NBC_00085]|uniref:hypothetical protein n=1 Tax=unclassified Kitasatospora TaxID=2633591 RepID=UPI00324EB605
MSSPPVAPAPRWPLILLRASATASALLALLQTVLAGGFLNGHYEALSMHAAGATALAAVVVCQLVSGALIVWPGRGPRRPLGVAALLTAAVMLQTGLGYNRAVGLHVVVGVLLVSGALFALTGAWRQPLPARPAAPAGADGPGDPDGAGLLPRPGGHVEAAQ